MSFMDLARKRYSSREYKDTPVEQEKIDAILEAGRISPTAVNAQPVRVIAVRTPEGLSKVSEGANIYGAPLAFIVYADRSKAWVRKYDGMNSAEIDASIVTTQMMSKPRTLDSDPYGSVTSIQRSSTGISDWEETWYRLTSLRSDTVRTQPPGTKGTAYRIPPFSDMNDLGITK